MEYPIITKSGRVLYEADIEKLAREAEIGTATHSHGRYSHKHAWAYMEHSHIMRAVCGDKACEGYATHNIHPRDELYLRDHPSLTEELYGQQPASS